MHTSTSLGFVTGAMRVHFFTFVYILIGTCYAADYKEISGYEGKSLRLYCYYPPGNEEKGKYFCQLQGFSCEDRIRTTVQNSWHKRGRFALFDNTSAHFFTLNISSLHMNDSGKYWCGVDISMLPDVNSEVRITVKKVVKHSGFVTTQKVVETISPAVSAWDGLERRDNQSHFRFLTVLTATCVGMLFFVCVFSLFHILKRIHSCNLSVSASYKSREKSNTEHTEDDYVRMEPGVSRVNSTVNSSSSELPLRLQPRRTGSAAVSASRPGIDSCYLDLLVAMTTDLDPDYIDPDSVPRLSGVYENLRSESLQEQIYHTIAVTSS